MTIENLKFLMRFSLHTLLLLLCYFLSVVNIYSKNLKTNNMSWLQENSGAVVQGGSGLVGGLLQFFGQRGQSKRANAFTEKMYNRQRADALADWQMQNAYNSPEQQMQRLKDAGLNPNLVYGNGSAANTSSDVRSSQSQVPQQVNTMEGLGNAISSLGMGYIDMKAKTAQTDNVEAQTQQVNETIRGLKLDNVAKALTYWGEIRAKNVTNDVTAKIAEQRAMIELMNLSGQGDLINAQYGNVTQDTLNKQKTGLYIDQQISTESLKQEIMRDDNTRAWIMNSSNVKEAAARIVSMAVSNAKSEAERNSIIQATTSQKFDNYMKMLEHQFFGNFKGGKAGAYYMLEAGEKITDFLTDIIPSKKAARTIIEGFKGKKTTRRY